MQLPINDISVNLRLTQVETSLYRHSRHTHAWCNSVIAVQQHQTTPPNPFTPNISLPTFTLAIEYIFHCNPIYRCVSAHFMSKYYAWPP